MSIRIQLIHFLFLCGVSYGLKAVLSDILETSQLLVVYNPTYFFLGGRYFGLFEK